MKLITEFLFLLSVLLMMRYLIVFGVNLMSNPPKKTKMRHYKDIPVDEIIIFFTISYFLTYIIFK
jgi:hypothetical protein